MVRINSRSRMMMRLRINASDQKQIKKTDHQLKRRIRTNKAKSNMDLQLISKTK